MSYISINKLLETLNKPIKNLAIYFDKSYEDFYDEKKINISPLLVGLNLTDGTKETFSFKQLRDLLPEIKYIKVPINIFKRCDKQAEVKKIIVDGKRIEFKVQSTESKAQDGYYYRCKLFNPKSFDQNKLDELIKERDEILGKQTSFDSSDEFI